MSARNKQKRRNNKAAALITVVLLLVAFAVMGTIAWLTATDEVTNTFTVGTFNKPEIPTDPINPDPEDPDVPEPVDPDDPNNPDSADDMDLDGYIIEPSWNKTIDHKLIPGVSFYKDPYVGIGENSESAVIYVYIDNPYSNKVYFTLNTGWSAVTGQSEPGFAEDTYTGGLFKYNTVLTSVEGDNAWTDKPVFDAITVDNSADAGDLTITGDAANEIKVSCFIHQAYDEERTAIPAATIENAAIAELVPGSSEP